MIDPTILWTFIPAVLALNLTPGADMMFCFAQGMRSGPRAALAASAGISAGAMVHVTIAGLGLGAIVATVPIVFDVIRWAGVAYLLYLAWGAIRHQPTPQGTASQPSARTFQAGFIVNLTNPKVILFVLAFVPQFVDPALGYILGQFLILGAVIALCSLVVNGLVGAFAGGAGRALTGSRRAARFTSWISGGVFAALAVRLATLEKA